MTGYSQLHDNTGFLGASPCTTSGSVTKVSSGITQDSGTYYWASGQHRRTVTAWDENVTNDTTYMTLSNPGVRNGVGFVAGLFRETASTDRVFYSYYVDSPTSYDFASTHHVRQIRSTADMASGSQSANWFQHCTATGGTTMSCASGSRLDLHSARSLSFGWLDFASGTDRTVVAWLNQDSTSLGQNSDSNRVRVSVGLVDDDTLAEPDDLPDFTSPTTIAGRSAVGPAVACKENYTSTYDCIVAWVPIDDIDNNIRVARFSVAPPGGGVNRYVATFESSYKSVGGTTADSLTAWWNSNTSKFYVAFRSSSTGQKVNVRRSSDGSAWSAEVTGLDDTYLPPSAAGTWTGSTNLLIYAK